MHQRSEALRAGNTYPNLRSRALILIYIQIFRILNSLPNLSPFLLQLRVHPPFKLGPVAPTSGQIVKDLGDQFVLLVDFAMVHREPSRLKPGELLRVPYGLPTERRTGTRVCRCERPVTALRAPVCAPLLPVRSRIGHTDLSRACISRCNCWKSSGWSVIGFLTSSLPTSNTATGPCKIRPFRSGTLKH